MIKLCFSVLIFAVMLGSGHGQNSSKTKSLAAKNSTMLNSADTAQIRQTAVADFAGRRHSESRSQSSLFRGRTKSTKGKKRRQRKRRRNGASKQDGAASDVLRDTMMHMFGFNHMPTNRKLCDHNQLNCGGKASSSDFLRSSRTSGRRSVGQKFKPNPPNFMLELYRTYSAEKDLTTLRLKSQGNTVRSFFPRAANALQRQENFGKSVFITPIPLPNTGRPRSSVFIFNVTSIPSVEDLVAADIHVDGNIANLETTDAVVGVYRLKHTDCADELDCAESPMQIFKKVGKSFLLGSLSGATSWSDPRLVKAARKARRLNHVVVLKFPSGRDGDRSRRQRRHFDSKRKRYEDLPDAFYADDGDIASVRSKREPDLSRLLDSELDDTSPTVVPMLILYCNDPSAVAQDEPPTTAPVIWRALGNITTSSRKRAKRSVPLPDDVSSRDVGVVNPDGGSGKRARDVSTRNTPYVVDKLKENGKRRRKNRKISNFRNTTSEEDHTRDRPRKNRRGGRKRKNRKNEKIDIKLHPSVKVERDDDRCGRKSLHVNFEDIGWSDWIISPKYFDAYYCSGVCQLPQMQESRTTNHAVIQAVVKTIVGHQGLPAPCCVPDKLMPLSVLFFDEDRNVVLKVFPNMSVETCACR